MHVSLLSARRAGHGPLKTRLGERVAANRADHQPRFLAVRLRKASSLNMTKVQRDQKRQPDDLAIIMNFRRCPCSLQRVRSSRRAACTSVIIAGLNRSRKNSARAPSAICRKGDAVRIRQSPARPSWVTERSAAPLSQNAIVKSTEILGGPADCASLEKPVRGQSRTGSAVTVLVRVFALTGGVLWRCRSRFTTGGIRAICSAVKFSRNRK